LVIDGEASSPGITNGNRSAAPAVLSDNSSSNSGTVDIQWSSAKRDGVLMALKISQKEANQILACKEVEKPPRRGGR
jgi:hypothetical protein